jgi:hypothetical protein
MDEIIDRFIYLYVFFFSFHLISTRLTFCVSPFDYNTIILKKAKRKGERERERERNNNNKTRLEWIE